MPQSSISHRYCSRSCISVTTHNKHQNICGCTSSSNNHLTHSHSSSERHLSVSLHRRQGKRGRFTAATCSIPAMASFARSTAAISLAALCLWVTSGAIAAQKSHRVAVVVPIAREDLERAVSALASWPCSKEENVSLLLLHDDEEAAASGARGILGAAVDTLAGAGGCFGEILTVFADLNEEMRGKKGQRHMYVVYVRGGCLSALASVMLRRSSAITLLINRTFERTWRGEHVPLSSRQSRIDNLL